MIRRIFLVFLVILLLAGVAAAVLARRALEQRGPLFAPPKEVIIDDGESLANIADRLAGEEILVNPRVFLALARWKGVDREVRSGVYDFSGNATAGEVLAALVGGPQRVQLVSIPEGWTVEQIAGKLEAAGLGPAQRYRELAADPEFVASLNVPAEHLEGYLFPDTYSFGDDPVPEAVLGRMIERFFEVFGEDLRREAQQSGLTVHEATTLASIVETEAAVADERALISAVFHNRLRRGMPLQADPTVLYGVEGRSKPIRKSDLKRKTAYNTYVIRGLPPGPIANPGLASLIAAVRPEPGVKALYFVARDDRTHVFSNTLREHSRAVRKYQR